MNTKLPSGFASLTPSTAFLDQRVFMSEFEQYCQHLDLSFRLSVYVSSDDSFLKVRPYSKENVLFARELFGLSPIGSLPPEATPLYTRTMLGDLDIVKIAQDLRAIWETIKGPQVYPSIMEFVKARYTVDGQVSSDHLKLKSYWRKRLASHIESGPDQSKLMSDLLYSMMADALSRPSITPSVERRVDVNQWSPIADPLQCTIKRGPNDDSLD